MHEGTFDGSKLRLAREFAGLTQTKLAERVVVTPGHIAKLERGERSVGNGDLLDALAEVLLVRPSFFVSPLSVRVGKDDCHFRSLASTSARMRARERARATMFSSLLDCLDAEVEIPEFTIPPIQAPRLEDAELVAERCRAELGLGPWAPIDNVVELLEACGVVVTRIEIATLKIDAFSWAQRRGVVVLSSDKESGTRSRFDAAHELGHVVMHRVAGQQPYDLRESQATAFASAFLLPRAAFVREFPAHFDWDALFRLKARWGASVAAMVRRARNLGLIGAAQYRQISKQIGMRGWRRQEPQEIPLEQPSVLSEALSLVNEESLLNSLGWTRETFEHVTGVALPDLRSSAPVIDLAGIRSRSRREPDAPT